MSADTPDVMVQWEASRFEQTLSRFFGVFFLSLSSLCGAVVFASPGGPTGTAWLRG